LLFRFRTDVWWFGTFALPRGLLLSMAIVLAGDSPYVQMLLIVSVMLLFMLVQLITWPWKLPALNAFDATISVCLILMMAILGAFAPDLSVDLQDALVSCVVGIVMFLNGIVFLMLCVTAFSLIRQNAMGGSQESEILALGKIPKPGDISSSLCLLSLRIQDLGEDSLAEVLSNLSVYDLRMAKQIVTAIGSEVGEQKLILSRRSQLMSTSSVHSMQRKLQEEMQALDEKEKEENGFVKDANVIPEKTQEQIANLPPTHGPVESAWL